MHRVHTLTAFGALIGVTLAFMPIAASADIQVQDTHTTGNPNYDYYHRPHSTYPTRPPHRTRTVCRWVPDYGYGNRYGDDWNWNHNRWSTYQRPHYHRVCRQVRY